MLEPCFPENEAERLSVLHSLNVLDSNSVEKLDRITRLAAKYFGVTIALVSLIDRDRQWFFIALRSGCPGNDWQAFLPFEQYSRYGGYMLTITLPHQSKWV
ncbi:hypothetical protein ABMB44_13165 [Levilactobacillus brevis]